MSYRRGFLAGVLLPPALVLLWGWWGFRREVDTLCAEIAGALHAAAGGPQ